MKKLTRCFLFAVLIVFSVSTAWATLYTLENKGDTTGVMSSGAVGVLYTDAMNDLWFTSSGTGVINPFLTIQSRYFEEGMNTDGSLLYDQKRGGNPGYTDAFTHSLLYSDLYLSPFPGMYPDYFAFSLDADEPNSTPWIALTGFEVWLVPSSGGGFIDTYSGIEAAGTQVFDLGTDQILLDYSVWKGSGNELDMALFVPYFTAGSDFDYVYVWIEMGGILMSMASATQGLTGDGPEEWIMFGTPTSVPEPSTFILLCTGLIGVGLLRKKFKK